MSDTEDGGTPGEQPLASTPPPSSPPAGPPPPSMPGGAGRGAGRHAPGLPATPTGAPSQAPAGAPWARPGRPPVTAPPPAGPAPGAPGAYNPFGVPSAPYAPGPGVPTVPGMAVAPPGLAVPPPGIPGLVVPPPAVPGLVPPPSLAGALGSIDGPRYQRKYPDSATSPLWMMLASYVGAIAFYALFVWVLADVADTETLDGFIDRVGDRMPILVLGFLVAYAIYAVWLSIIGSNDGSYGVGLVFAATFPWHLAFFIIPLIGPIFWIGALAVVFFWPYRLLITRLWVAGGLPSAWALLGWLPWPVALAFLTGPEAFQAVGALLLPVPIGFFFIATLTVTILQHIGIRQDRRADDERRRRRAGLA